ncbi:hypothetical protein [Mesorhizobium sp. M0244]|uniref:IS1096 element passenger TnpR family protein n=1 Tax=Mesorhizobium sp. M0244 TaxID=2956926 RepID=UPI00333A4532
MLSSCTAGIMVRLGPANAQPRRGGPRGDTRRSPTARAPENPLRVYEYDFGDLWEHEIRVEAKHEREGGKVYPVCIAGARAGPPEGIGGPPGYAALLGRLRFGDIDRLLRGEDEEFEDDDPLRTFEPERFSRREVNAALKRELSGLTKG